MLIIMIIIMLIMTIMMKMITCFNQDTNPSLRAFSHH